jgi:Glycosyl transferases group 1
MKFENNVWFILPDINCPTGGINNIYKICALFNEIGIKSRILSGEPFPFADPIDNQKYWIEYSIRHHYDYPEIQAGDIIVKPEVYAWKPTCSVPIRRVTYIQNWGLSPHRTYEDHYWVYNNSIHLSYCLDGIYERIDSLGRNRVPTNIPWNIWNTIDFIKKEKVLWSFVTPFFDKNDFKFNNKNDTILMFPRKSPEIVDVCKGRFADKLISVDGKHPDEVKKIMSECGIIILPSPAEGLCFPAIEAIYSGTAVVAWECGSVEEYLIDGVTAMMAETANLEELVQKTQYLLDNPDKRIEITQNAYQFLSNRYTKEDTKRELLVAYFNCLKKKPTND